MAEGNIPVGITAWRVWGLKHIFRAIPDAIAILGNITVICGIPTKQVGRRVICQARAASVTRIWVVTDCIRGITACCFCRFVLLDAYTILTRRFDAIVSVIRAMRIVFAFFALVIVLAAIGC